MSGLDEILVVREREVADRPHLHSWECAAAIVLVKVLVSAPARLAFPLPGLPGM